MRKHGLRNPQQMPKDKIIHIYTDGACRGNPGPGGWGAILTWKGYEREISGGESHTTNNRMELTAVIRALEALNKTLEVEIYSDSSYVIKGMTEWLPNWRRRGWKRSHGKLENIDLWQRLAILADEYKITWRWVKGHAGHPMNERVDKLAVKAIP